jgi:hypothetical protein
VDAPSLQLLAPASARRELAAPAAAALAETRTIPSELIRAASGY